MLKLLVQNTVKDYHAWRSIFDENAHTLEPAGLSIEWIRRSADDPQEVWFCLHAEDRAKADAYLADPTHAEIGQRAGVIDGQITYLFPDTELLPPTPPA